MSTSSNCPCDVCVFPEVISNPPGLSTIQYRAGDFTGFRDQMLLSLPGEIELTNWKPTATTDLALQMIEWWAYLADILTFYNQRIANQDYLRTADLDASVNRLIRVLGYRPRPGIGATATLAALVSARQPILLPEGFAVQSKPGPGQTPQIFELSGDTTVQPGGSVSADPDNSQAQLGADGSVYLHGTVNSIRPGDLLVLVPKGWSGTDSNYIMANVQSVNPQVSPRGTTNTQVVFSSSALPLPAGAIASNYRLLRSAQAARLFQYKVSIDLSLIDDGTTGTADLDSAVRQIKPGDLILFDSTNGQTSVPIAGPPISTGSSFSYVASTPKFGYGGQYFLDYLQVDKFGQTAVGPIIDYLIPTLQLAAVNSYTEIIWYADNPKDPTNASSATAGIPVLHSEITFSPGASASDASALVIRYGWQDVGMLIPPPATSFDGSVELLAVKPPTFSAGEQYVLIEDANGAGVSAKGFVDSKQTFEMQLEATPVTTPRPTLVPPIDVLTNLLAFTRGKTVANEILGSGDATAAGQEFTLAKSPLTYLLSGDSSSGANYTSTLKVWVNSVEWTEQPSFYGQPADAAIFVTREDENNVTHVQFGDGMNGARLPSGTNNIVASYRFGSGEDSPDAGTLTVIAKAQPGLSKILNPVAASGGADPEPSSRIRKYAPLSVMAFGRAISGDDYEAIAASTPGVSRASAVWSFDPLQQRTVVTVYVGDDVSAKNAALLALRGDADPNRPVNVQLATQLPLKVSLTLEVDPRYIIDTVVAAALTALTDPDAGLFGANRIGIGEVIYKSQIFAACLSVVGAVAVHSLIVTGAPAGVNYRFDPGEGSYFSVDPVAGLKITGEVSHA
jgi:Baseplate J-like protein